MVQLNSSSGLDYKGTSNGGVSAMGHPIQKDYNPLEFIS